MDRARGWNAATCWLAVFIWYPTLNSRGCLAAVSRRPESRLMPSSVLRLRASIVRVSQPASQVLMPRRCREGLPDWLRRGTQKLHGVYLADALLKPRSDVR